jgi:AraC family transcriptional regulator
MADDGWTLEAEIAGGVVWVGVSTRRAIDQIDRTHHAEIPRVAMWLSGKPRASRARFLGPELQSRFSSIGGVIAIPADVHVQVLGDHEPEGRMVHCNLPPLDGLKISAATPRLDRCFDLRSPSIAACLRRLAKEAMAPSFASATIVEGLGLFMAAELSNHLQQLVTQAIARGGLAPWQLNRIDEHLQAGNWNCSVSDLARLCGVGPSHTMRAFREATGRSISKHVAELRVQRAQNLLANSMLSISEIGQGLQFAYPSAFAAAFRRVMGVSPRQYRQSARTLRE